MAFPFFNTPVVSIRRLAGVIVLSILLFCSPCLRADMVWIHHIGVGQGDATLIVAYQTNTQSGLIDTTSILIDAGNSSGKGLAVFNYINVELGTTKHLNYIITSHLHSDHIGGMPKVLEMLHANGWRVDYILDRGATKAPKADSCYSTIGFVDNDTVQPFDLPGSRVYDSYTWEVENYYPNRRSNPRPGDDLFRVLNRKANMSMLTVASNGCVLERYNSTSISCPYKAHTDENDFSFAFLFSFEGFKYFTAGDLGGQEPYYLDLETPLIAYFRTYPEMDFHFCVYKASHHGSSKSNNENFINYTDPTVTVIPSALRSFGGTQLPEKSTLDRLALVHSKLLYTYNYDTQPYSGTISSFVDVKLSVTDPGYYTDIIMPVFARQRSKTSPYNPIGAFVQLPSDTCRKYHPKPDELNAPSIK
ncbi:MAG TPA: MBL fold metallo-hydrolase [Ferruginibacter sp.]|nr:MBL fold metallo-hydrolase [Ferruginibacter sp.]